MVIIKLGPRSRAVALALVADRALGEPPAGAHPVALFGRAMTRMEGRIWADDRRAGVRYALAGIGAAVVAGWIVARRGRLIGLAAATYLAVAGRALCEAAEDVAAALEAGDLDAARDRLRALVGRETARLDRTEICRAVVESVAENTVDAVTAPMLWAAWAGPAGVLGYRAANTLDAMVGHRSPRYERFGWAAARADDGANWLPARITAAAVAAVRPHRAVAIAGAVRRQAPTHPSPNAGVAEAAFAAALGLRLGGTNDYAGRMETRPLLGSGAAPAVDDIRAACRLSRHTAAAVGVAIAAGSLVGRRS